MNYSHAKKCVKRQQKMVKEHRTPLERKSILVFRNQMVSWMFRSGEELRFMRPMEFAASKRSSTWTCFDFNNHLRHNDALGAVRGPYGDTSTNSPWSIVVSHLKLQMPYVIYLFHSVHAVCELASIGNGTKTMHRIFSWKVETITYRCIRIIICMIHHFA